MKELTKSQEVHKESVLERSNEKKYTDSPLEDSEIKEEALDILEKKYGKEVAEEVVRKMRSDNFKNEVIKTKNFLLPGDIQNSTKHLPNYELVKNVIALQGDEYTTITKEIYKTLISLSIPEHLRIIKVGEIVTDLRVHPTSILSSGKGKKNICEGFKKIYKNFKPDANIKEPRTIHYQHLIGKMLLRKTEVENGVKKDGTPKFKKVEEWIPKYGFLKADVLFLEESYELFNSQEKNDVDCRDSITIALDCWGNNLIMKQNMDNLDTKEETLSYYPYVTIIPFLQPLKMNESFISKGLGRRLHTCYRDFPKRTKLDKYVNRLTSKIDDSSSSKEFSDYMRNINNIKTEWELSEDSIETFTICHASLLEEGFRQGGKISHYTRILEFPMQNLLLKMSAIQALTDLRTKITKEDVELAFVDIIERLVWEFIYVDRKVKGTLDYGESWGGAVGKSQECLQKLFERGAESRETSIPIWQFQEIISETYPLSIRRSRDRYKEMVKEELIEDFKGQGKDNGVWLKFKPKNGLEGDEEEDEILDPKRLYLEILGRTGRSGRTPKTHRPLIIKTDLSTSIEDIDDKHTPKVSPKQPKQKNKKIVGKLKANNTPLSVRPVRPVRPEKKQNPESTRDLHYSEDPVCDDIKDCNPQDVLKYMKKNPETEIPKLIELFGPGVMKLKREGLIQ